MAGCDVCVGIYKCTVMMGVGSRNNWKRTTNNAAVVNTFILELKLGQQFSLGFTQSMPWEVVDI